MIEISKSEIELFLTTTQFKLKPSQSAVSYPILTRILNRLQQNKRFSSIKVHGNIIIDGHHRFICYSYLNIPIEISKSGNNPSSINLDWNSIMVDPIDYDSKADKIYYSKLFDS